MYLDGIQLQDDA